MSFELREYWVHMDQSSSPAMLWDAFKAYARGRYQFNIAKVRKGSHILLSEAEARAGALEARYLSDLDQSTHKVRVSAYRELALLCADACRWLLLAQSQCIFEQVRLNERFEGYYTHLYASRETFVLLFIKGLIFQP